MNLTEYIKKNGRGTLSGLAKQIEGHASDISDWANGYRPVPPSRCVAIESATAGKVTRQDLRPDDYWLIWPELVEKVSP